MPRTLDAALLAAMNAGSFTPWFRVQLLDVDRTSVMYSFTDVLGFELDGLTAKVDFHDPNNVSEYTTFRIQRGITVDGVPNFVTSSQFYPTLDRHEKRIRHLEGYVFPGSYFTTPGDVTYSEIITALCTEFGLTPVHANPAAAWLAYQFYPTGRTFTLNNARQFFTILRQKYLVFATDMDDDNLYFYHATNAIPAYPAGYVQVSPGLAALPGPGSVKSKSFLSRDEANTTHTSGDPTNPIHNLGFLHSTASHPARTSFTDTTDWIVKDLAPNLKYFDFDSYYVRFDIFNLQLYPGKVRELFDKKLHPSWQWQIRFLDIFANTEGGAIPSTIEASAPYTPINVSNFDVNLNSTVNNLQALADKIDELDCGPAFFACTEKPVLDANDLFMLVDSDTVTHLVRTITYSDLAALISTAAHDHNHADLTSLDYASSGHSDFAGTGVVNVFNAAQMIDGLNNEIQLRVQAADAQTEYIQTWEDADASVEAAMSVTGHIGLGGLPMSNSALAIAETFDLPNATGDCYGAYIRPYFNATIDQTTSHQYALSFLGQSLAASSYNYYMITHIQGAVRHNGTGVLANGKAIDVQFGNNTGSGASTTMYGVYIATFNTGGAINKSYGLYIDAINSATTNYAIYTNAGLHVFNAGGDPAADFTVKSDTYNAIFVDSSLNSIVIMSNAAGKIGFFAAAAVAQAAALTTQLTTITHTAPGTPDYAIQNLTSGGYGFVTADEGNSVLKVIANLQTRVAELETKFKAYGLLP